VGPAIRRSRRLRGPYSSTKGNYCTQSGIKSASVQVVDTADPDITRIEDLQDLRTHPHPYVTASQLARYWRVSLKHIHKQIDRGVLHAVRLGPRLLRIRTADAIRFEQLANTSIQSRIETPAAD
jgi:excisionase family DNA binding protein